MFESRSWRDVLDTTLCDKVSQLLTAGLRFSPGTPVSSTNKTDHNDITEILLKVALNSNTITLYTVKQEPKTSFERQVNILSAICQFDEIMMVPA